LKNIREEYFSLFSAAGKSSSESKFESCWKKLLNLIPTISGENKEEHIKAVANYTKRLVQIMG